MTINNKVAAQFCRRNSDGDIIMVADTHHRRVEAWIDSKGNTASWDHPDAHTVRVDWDYAMSLSDWEEMI